MFNCYFFRSITEELERLDKIKLSEENRTKLLLKRLENESKSTAEAIQKTKQEIEKKEKINEELSKNMKEQQHKLRLEAMREKERIEQLRAKEQEEQLELGSDRNSHKKVQDSKASDADDKYASMDEYQDEDKNRPEAKLLNNNIEVTKNEEDKKVSINEGTSPEPKASKEKMVSLGTTKDPKK